MKKRADQIQSGIRWMRNHLLAVARFLVGSPRRSRWILSAGFVAFCVLVLPQGRNREYFFEVGKPWQQPDLVAPFDFPKIKPPRKYNADVTKAEKRAPEVFVANQNLRKKSLETTASYFAVVSKYLDDFLLRPAHLRNITLLEEDLSALDPPYKPDYAALKALPQGLKTGKFLTTSLTHACDSLLEEGYLNRPPDESLEGLLLLRFQNNEEELVEPEFVATPQNIQERLQDMVSFLPGALKEPTVSVLEILIQPNYIYNEKASDLEREKAIANVSKVYGKVKAGTRIVSRGQMVTEEVEIALDSLETELGSRKTLISPWAPMLGKTLCVGLLLVILLVFLRINHPLIYHRPRNLSLVYAIYLLVVSLAGLFFFLQENSGNKYNYFYLLPVGIAPVLCSIFFDSRAAIFLQVPIILLIGLSSPVGYEFVLIQICGGASIVYSLGHLRRRSQFYRTTFSLVAAYSVAFIGYQLVIKERFDTVMYENLLMLCGAALLTLMAYPLVYAFEKLFGVTSDLTLIELMDTDHPLLRELSVKAPGTFQHSLQVANMTEAVLMQIGGDSLKAKVGALYHDIGKINNPSFFVENRHNDYNPHDKIPAKDSAATIIKHVKDGLQLSKHHGLPPEIRDFIRTHHGTTRTEFFYHKAITLGEVKEGEDSAFRYPGPLPNTRETGILMLTDGVEAAARTLHDPGPENIRALVDRIIDQKIAEGQLELTNLSFKDVRRTKAILYELLGNIYHARVAYPERVPIEP